jgi:hypothetical protein
VSLDTSPFLVSLGFALLAGACTTEGNVFSLGVGQCFVDDVGAVDVSNVGIVDCTEPHLNEIFALPELPDGDFPLVTVDEDSAMLCFDNFNSYVGVDYSFSIYEVGFLRPSQETWAELDDREVVCYLFDMNGETKTGTARASGR